MPPSLLDLEKALNALTTRVNALVSMVGTDAELEAIMRIGEQKHTPADLETLRAWLARIRATPRPI